MRRWLASLRGRGLVAQSAVLVAAILALYAVVAPVAGVLGGVMGLAAAAVAAALCLGGAEVALAVCCLFRDPRTRWQGALIGMLPRMALPLFGAVLIQVHGGRLAEAGVLIYLVVFYLVTLFVETALSLPYNGGPRRHGDASRRLVL